MTTEHRPGIQPADVDELLEHGAKIVVLSRGVLGRLRISPDSARRDLPAAFTVTSGS